VWIFVCAVPLIFAFAYARFLFTNLAPQGRRKYAVLLNSVGVVATTVLFSVLATPFWKNPMRDIEGNTRQALGLIAVLAVFLVAAITLLVKNKSSLAALASILFWPYWLLIALSFLDRWFQVSDVQAACYFLCFASPSFFAFAAGAVPYRPVVAHSTALMGVVSVPWIYRDLISSNGLGDSVWLMFNQPNNTYGIYAMYPPYAVLGICTVALIAFALTTAVLRLLPTRWEFRKTRLAERTWPALATSFVVLAAWFSQSVLPYRIPGAVDFRDYPVLQILHVEKRGLQFHERCFSVYWQRPYRPASVSFRGSDRRLFQYRFQNYSSSLQLPKALGERIQALVESSAHEKRQQDVVKPIWNWNADRWYFSSGSGLREYGAFNGSNPPQEVVDLFRELDGTPRNSETQSELKDVCLGFCYDPLSAMGWLYSNHRCFNDSHGVVCR
jgi:hypothetical protein